MLTYSRKFISFRNLAIIGLLLLTIGSGGILACDVSLGADQFQLPEQKSLMDTFFSLCHLF
jgi:dipeptide/tripeptide permease